MSYTGLLNDTCDIEDFTSVADAHNQPTKTWATKHGATPCRMTSTKGDEIHIRLQVMVSYWKLFIENIAVTEQDRVLFGGDYYNILLVQPCIGYAATHHMELNLEKVE